ncbi:hypothetical protein H632_c2601p1, partial [Helicosporidium sp. ATCC 50920]
MRRDAGKKASNLPAQSAKVADAAVTLPELPSDGTGLFDLLDPDLFYAGSARSLSAPASPAGSLLRSGSLSQAQSFSLAGASFSEASAGFDDADSGAGFWGDLGASADRALADLAPFAGAAGVLGKGGGLGGAPLSVERLRAAA